MFYTQYSSTYVKHYRLIRILSEQGKSAAEFAADGRWLSKVRGRVIDRDGAITEFNDREDFVDIMAFRTRREKAKVKILIPPGLTDDCIVEIEWTMNGSDGMEGDADFMRDPIAEPYYCAKKVLDMTAIKSRGYTATRYVWNGVKAPTTFTKTRYAGSKNTLVYENIPPRKEHPYGNRFLDPNLAFFMTFKTFPDFGGQIDKFWPRFCKSVLKENHDRIVTGGSHRAWLKDLETQLSADPATDPRQNPVAAAKATLAALHRRISLTHMLSPEQLTAYRNQKDRSNPKLEHCFRDGWATPDQITHLFIKSLRDLGIKEKLVFTNTLDDPPLRPEELNPYAFNWWMPLVLVEQGQDKAMFCAWRPSLPAGYLPADKQGLPALIVDPKGWDHTFGQTLMYGPNANQQQTTYEAAFDEDGRYTIAMEQIGTGFYNAVNKFMYFSLTDGERDQLLQERWQRRFGDQFHIDNVTITGDRDLQKLTTIEVKANLTMSLDSAWISVNPFPGSFIDLSSPPMWQPDRTEPIVLERPFYQMDTMRLKLPNGWSLKGKPSWKKSNDIGSVKFVAVQEGNTVTIQRVVQLNGHLFHADAQELLRVFLAWVNEVEMQHIAIADGGA